MIPSSRILLVLASILCMVGAARAAAQADAPTTAALPVRADAPTTAAAAESDSLRREAAALQARLQALQGEREALEAQVAAAVRDREAARLAEAASQASREAAEKERDAALQGRESARREAEQARAEAETARKGAAAAAQAAAEAKQAAEQAAREAGEARRERDAALQAVAAAQADTSASLVAVRTARLEIDQMRRHRGTTLVAFGDLLLARDEPGEARKRYAEAADLVPDWFLPRLRTAQAWRREGKLDESDGAVLQALPLGADRAVRDEAYRYAAQRLGARQYPPAAALFEALRRHFPEDPPIRCGLFEAWNGLKQFDRVTSAGLPLAEAWIAERSDDRRTSMGLESSMPPLARALLEKGQIEPFIGKVEETLKARPDPRTVRVVLSPCLLLIGERLVEQSKFKEALAHLERAADLDPANVALRRQVAKTLRQSDPEKGVLRTIGYLRKTLETAPGDRGIQEDLGYYLIESEQFADAEAIYRKLLVSFPEVGYYQDRLLLALTRLKRFEEGAQILRKRFQAVRDSTGDPAQREVEIERLETLNPDIMEFAGLYEENLADMWSRLAREPENAALHLHLANRLLDHGAVRMALAEHLRAALLAGQAQPLAEAARKLADAGREKDSVLYIEAVYDHFRRDPAVFAMMDLLMRLKKGGNREPFEFPEMAACRTNEAVCRAIEADPQAPGPVRLRAAVDRIWYHYRPLPHSRALGMKARAEYAEFLKRPELSDELRKRAQGRLENIEQEWIQAP